MRQSSLDFPTVALTCLLIYSTFWHLLIFYSEFAEFGISHPSTPCHCYVHPMRSSKCSITLLENSQTSSLAHLSSSNDSQSAPLTSTAVRHKSVSISTPEQLKWFTILALLNSSQNSPSTCLGISKNPRSLRLSISNDFHSALLKSSSQNPRSARLSNSNDSRSAHLSTI